MIEKRRFGRAGHMSTVTIFGAAALKNVSQGEADRALELLLEHGVNHIDTAPRYGDAELRIGPVDARASPRLLPRDEDRAAHPREGIRVTFCGWWRGHGTRRAALPIPRQPPAATSSPPCARSFPRHSPISRTATSPPWDFAQAVIGPGMAVFTRSARVLEADGSPMSVRSALVEINRTLDETPGPSLPPCHTISRYIR